MSFAGKLHRGFTRRLGKVIHPFWPGELLDVVFVVGCPRSGTSVFDHILNHRPKLLYTHEPRYIWRHVNPELRSRQSPSMRGRLLGDANDLEKEDRCLPVRWFHLAATHAFRRPLMDKKPLNLSVRDQDHPILEGIIMESGPTSSSLEFIRWCENRLAYGGSEPDQGQVCLSGRRPCLDLSLGGI